ncbi:MAG: N-acetylmuramoyl-L-alanine amidase [Holosporales bacterium]|jgi:N-acetyl-anhydromuramyl-L-alanine amidase AmpD|nr:N-acetylmuramoyl-L-alanine amidase [Holosporales bacterium]
MKSLCVLLFTFIASVAGGAMPDFSLPGVEIENEHLDNSRCASGFMFRRFADVDRKDARVPADYNGGHWGHIALRYAHTPRLDVLRGCYEKDGTSAHFGITPDGRIICFVNPDCAVSYLLGQSGFGGKNMFNYWAVTVHLLTPGSRAAPQAFEVFGVPQQVPGDPNFWYVYPPAQLDAAAGLICGLQARYGIPGCNVLGQSDLRPGGAIDPGPMFDWFGIYSRFSAGFHPGFFPSALTDIEEGRYVAAEACRVMTEETSVRVIMALGYEGSGPNIVRAYKFHFLQDELSPDVTDPLKLQLLWHVYKLNELQCGGERFGSSWSALISSKPELPQVMVKLDALVRRGEASSE